MINIEGYAIKIFPYLKSIKRLFLLGFLNYFFKKAFIYHK